MQDSSTSRMIFGVPQILAYASSLCTLEPGDIISTGTPSGVGHAQSIRLTPGDVLEAEIEGIGVLRSPVVAEAEG
jgi:2-keto-4-pentenoate hydratase/2-oxohepta-3-ene-1,7-dioic acid hydratase in catechol pathway